MNKIIAIGESIQDGIPTPDEPKEILNKYIDLIDKGYCCDCNELNCIDNFPQAKIAHSIKCGTFGGFRKRERGKDEKGTIIK